MHRSIEQLITPVRTLALLLYGILCGCSGPAPKGFATLQDGVIMLHDAPFFPVVMNYHVNLVNVGDQLWPASYCGYRPEGHFRFSDAEQSALQIRAELALLRAQGFNTVRVTGFTEGPVILPEEDRPQLRVRRPDGHEEFHDLAEPGLLDRYHAAVRAFMDLARAEDMRVILLTTIHEDRPGSKAHFTEVADLLRNDTMVLAFDLFNEPLYFDVPAREKDAIHRIVKGWRKLANRHAPHHLITIGLTGIRETHAWDPHILDVDFISFHPYEYEPDQVLNELRWYGRHVRIPWMIGETSLPADDDSVSFADMSAFARRTLEQTVACGGIGYSWWQFKDVEWGRFHSDFMGMMSMAGHTDVPGHPIGVEGTLKPVAGVFRTFDPTGTYTCEDLPNYLNYSGHRTARLTGRLVDGRGGPIEGGVVLAWNEDFSHSYHTTSRADGTFTLDGDMYFYHWIASANGHEMVRGGCSPGSLRMDGDGVPALSLGDLSLKRLSYARY
jgi:hypothetical protein